MGPSMDGPDPPRAPYRVAGAPSPKVEPDAEADRGSERSVHRAAIGMALFFPLLTVATILLVGAAMTPELGLTAWMIVIPFAIAGGGLFGVGPYRLRGARVVLHQRGLVVTLRGRRHVIAFDDLREVWWDGLSRGPPGQVALFRWMPVFPGTTIRLDRVPHPGLFVRLLREAAPKVETVPRVPDA
jgi:hypothetical protein